jgi:hypothetical protein
MSAWLDIPPIPGVPDEFIQTLNDRGRRLVRGAASTASTIYTVVSATGSGDLVGTHAERLGSPAAAFGIGTKFTESDRGNALYDVQDVGGANEWVWLSGEMRAALASKPTDLGANDAGFLFVATNFVRRYRWTGSAWERAPGERPTREFVYVPEDPGTGWQLCDGSAGITYTKADATTATMTVPNEIGKYRKGAAAYTGTANAGSLPAITGSSEAVSAGTPAGTVSQPTLTMNSYTPGGTVSQPTFTGNALGAHQHELPMRVAGTTILAANAPFGTSGSYAMSGSYAGTGTSGNSAVDLTNNASAGTPSGTVSQPTFTGTPATLTGTVSQPTFTGSALATHSHGAGTYALAAVAEPDNVEMLPYMKL